MACGGASTPGRSRRRLDERRRLTQRGGGIGDRAGQRLPIERRTTGRRGRRVVRRPGRDPSSSPRRSSISSATGASVVARARSWLFGPRQLGLGRWRSWSRRPAARVLSASGSSRPGGPASAGGRRATRPAEPPLRAPPPDAGSIVRRAVRWRRPAGGGRPRPVRRAGPPTLGRVSHTHPISPTSSAMSPRPPADEGRIVLEHPAHDVQGGGGKPGEAQIAAQRGRCRFDGVGLFPRAGHPKGRLQGRSQPPGRHGSLTGCPGL